MPSVCIAHWVSTACGSVRQHMPHCSDGLLEVVDLLVKAQALHIKLITQAHTHISTRGIDGDEGGVIKGEVGAEVLTQLA